MEISVNAPLVLFPDFVEDGDGVGAYGVDEPDVVVVQGAVDDVGPAFFGAAEEREEDGYRPCDASAVIRIGKDRRDRLVDAHRLAEG